MSDSTRGRRERIAALNYDYEAQPRVMVQVCNLCSSTEFVVLTHRDRYGFAAQANACRRCGLVFLNPRMTDDAYGLFYDGVYRPLVSAFHGRLIDARTIQGEQREYAKARADFIRPFVATAKPRSLLDIGGSTGVVAAYMAKEFGLRSTIIDPAPLEVEQARLQGLETITGLVERHEFAGRQFDLVLICQTVDHLLDVAGTLRRVRELLTEHGLCFVDIVDFRAAYLRNWSIEEAIKIDHVYYLTDPTIRSFLRRAGLHVLRAEFAPDYLHVSYLCAVGDATDDALPARDEVDALFREIRFVQNARRPV